MYRLGTRARHHKRWIIGGFVIAALLLLGMSTYVFFGLDAQNGTQVHNGTAVTKSYNPSPTTVTAIDTTYFTLKLPAGWAKDMGQGRKSPPPGYAYVNTDHTQMLSVYIDTPPTSLAANRVIVVSANGSKVNYDMVSDNCADYTSRSKIDPLTDTVTALWQGVGFTCDLGNYTRNVVGITSKDLADRIQLTGATTGLHTIYLTYNDTAVSPDFSPLYAILDSFSLK